MIEQARGCGYRSVGGLYIRGTGIAVGCDRIPYLLECCPVCGSGIKFIRGYQMIDWFKFAGIHEPCKDKHKCPICMPEEAVKHAIMWVGDKYYSPSSFIEESQKQGICKRIASVPKDVKIGETWILLAHKKAGAQMVPDDDKTNGNETLTDPPMKEIQVPAVFYAFRPTHVELIITKWQARKKKFIEDLRKRGITLVVATKVDRKTGNVLETEILEEK